MTSFGIRFGKSENNGQQRTLSQHPVQRSGPELLSVIRKVPNFVDVEFQLWCAWKPVYFTDLVSTVLVICIWKFTFWASSSEIFTKLPGVLEKSLFIAMITFNVRQICFTFFFKLFFFKILIIIYQDYDYWCDWNDSGCMIWFTRAWMQFRMCLSSSLGFENLHKKYKILYFILRILVMLFLHSLSWIQFIW